MTFREKLNASSRRSILSFLAYDADYKLNDKQLRECFDGIGESVTADSLHNHLRWLEEQGFVSLDKVSIFTIVALTDRGLDIALGKARAEGVRNLYPSELADIGLK